MMSRCSIALIPAGTGNDFARGFACKQQAWYDAVFNLKEGGWGSKRRS